MCHGVLDPEEAKRGIVEFYDGWCWVCGKCRKSLAGTLVDMTQSEDWGKQETLPYSKRSHKRTLQYLEREHHVVIAQIKGELDKSPKL